MAAPQWGRASTYKRCAWSWLMSFLSDLFHGNFGNLGEDIAPQNIFKDFGSSFANQPMWAQGLELALPAIATGGALLAPELLGAGAAAEGGLAAAEGAAGGIGGFDLGTIGPGVAAAGGTVDIGPPVLSDAALSALEQSPGAAAMGSVGDVAFAGSADAVPFTNMTLGGGFPSVEGGVGTGGIMDFSPSTEIATGGNVLPNIGAVGGAGGAG